MLNDKLIVSRDNNYIMYKLTNMQNISYYAYISSKQVNQYRMFIGFSKGNNDNISLDVLNIGNKLIKDYDDCVYVVPLIDTKRLDNNFPDITNNLYENVLSEIQTVTNDIAIKIFEDKNHKISFVQTINFILQNDNQKKFASWLDKKMPNYIHSIDMINEEKKNFFDSLQEIYGDSQINFDDNLIIKNDENVFAQSDKNLVQRLNNRNENLFNMINNSNNLHVNINNSPNTSDSVNKFNNTVIKKRVKYSSGFGKIVGFILLLIVSLFIGLGIGYLVLG